MRALPIFIFILSIGNLLAQDIDYTQYYLNLAGLNSGFTGIEDFLDVKLATRQGWNNFGEKNSHVFVSAYGTIKNANLSPLKNSSLRLSNPEYYNRILSKKNMRRKQGIGGMITNQDIGLYKSVRMTANYAYHLPISKKLNWSLGAKLGYINQKINFAGYTVRDEINDTFYQQLIKANQGTENLILADFGSALYSNNFYIGVSSVNLMMKRLGGFDLLSTDQSIHYSVQTGGNISLGNGLLLQPGFKLTVSEDYPLYWAVNARLKYKDFMYGGIAYENEVKISALFGFFINNTYSIHYAYDKYLNTLNSFNVSVHEVVVGISLSNRYGLKPKFI